MSPAETLRLHVLIDSLDVGGAEALLADFAIGASAAGIELSVGHLHGSGAAAARLRELGVEPVQVPINSLLGRRDRRAVREHLRAVRPDLLHTHLDYADLLGGLAARGLGIPAVSTLHLSTWDGDLRDRLRFRIIARARRRSDESVIAVSEAARRSYLDHGWDSPDHVVTVHNGIADRFAPGSGPAVREQLGLATDDLVIGMVSVLRGDKGHEIAADAALELRARFPELRLLVVGDGPKRAEIEAAMTPLGDAAVFAGYRTDIERVLDAIDVLVHPSSHDAFPSAVVQAMGAGVPTVAAAVGGIPEAVNDGETGFLIPAPARSGALAAALTPLLGDPMLRREVATSARRRYEAEFSVDRWIERLLPVYERALGAGAAD